MPTLPTEKVAPHVAVQLLLHLDGAAGELVARRSSRPPRASTTARPASASSRADDRAARAGADDDDVALDASRRRRARVGAVTRSACSAARPRRALGERVVDAAEVAVELRVVEVRDLERRGQRAQHGAARGCRRVRQRSSSASTFSADKRRQRRAMAQPAPPPRAPAAWRDSRAPTDGRRHRQEVIDLLDGARAAAGEVAPLGHRRARHGEQRSALTPRQQRRTRAFSPSPAPISWSMIRPYQYWSDHSTESQPPTGCGRPKASRLHRFAAASD